MDISIRDPLWADLINSDWRDYRGSGKREDRLLNDSWLAAFLVRAGWHVSLPASGDRICLLRLRALLRRMVETLITGRGIQKADLEDLNVFLSNAPVISRLERQGSRWCLSQVPKEPAFWHVPAAIALSFASILVAGDPERFKVCANPDCGWVFYDASHNRTRRWCDVKECGNLIKVRRFRARKNVKI